MAAEIDLGLIARQQQALLAEMAMLRDDMSVLIAVVQRLDGTVSGLVNEIRAPHTQQSRMDRRLRELEAAKESAGE